MKFLARNPIQPVGLGLFLMLSVVLLLTQFTAYADPIPKGWQASNMKVIGYSGLDGRGGALLKWRSGRVSLYGSRMASGMNNYRYHRRDESEVRKICRGAG